MFANFSCQELRRMALKYSVPVVALLLKSVLAIHKRYKF